MQEFENVRNEIPTYVIDRLENEHLSIVDRAIHFCDICDSEMVAERRASLHFGPI